MVVRTIVPPKDLRAIPTLSHECMAMQVETKFVRLRNPAKIGDHIDGWRVCWLGGWDKGQLFFVVMLEKLTRSARARAG